MKDIAKLTYKYQLKLNKIDCVLKLIEEIIDDNDFSFSAFTKMADTTNVLTQTRQKLTNEINKLIKQNDKKILKS